MTVSVGKGTGGIETGAAMRIIRRASRSTTPPLTRAMVMPPFETIHVDSMTAACNGGGGALGHPKIYLNLAPTGRIECPYCSRLFIHTPKHGAGHASPAPGH